MKPVHYLVLATVLLGGAVVSLALWQAGSNGSGQQEKQSTRADVSPLPNFKGNYVSGGGSGKIHKPAETSVFGFMKREDPIAPPKADCSQKAIIYYARKAPDNFREDKKGLLYGVRTHTNATAIDTPIGRFNGFNSCALVVSSIMRKAGCRWMRVTANAKAIYDMAYRKGWRPTLNQDGGCIVAWNARWEGKRARIGRGIHAKMMPKNNVMFRHVGVTTDDGISMDNSGVMSRPSEYSTYRPIRYEPPIYLCPSFRSAIRKKK